VFIAHIPAGFLLTQRLLHAKQAPGTPMYGYLLLLGMFAAAFPDCDFIYAHLIDHMRYLHHSYWTHIPLFWLCLYAVTYLLTMQYAMARLIAQIVCFNALLHCVLDTTSGGILWLYPWSGHFFRLMSFPPHHGGWHIDILWQSTFLPELLIIGFASWRAWQLREYLLQYLPCR
jgi:inner membrane protein